MSLEKPHYPKRLETSNLFHLDGFTELGKTSRFRVAAWLRCIHGWVFTGGGYQTLSTRSGVSPSQRVIQGGIYPSFEGSWRSIQYRLSVGLSALCNRRRSRIWSPRWGSLRLGFASTRGLLDFALLWRDWRPWLTSCATPWLHGLRAVGRRCEPDDVGSLPVRATRGLLAFALLRRDWRPWLTSCATPGSTA